MSSQEEDFTQDLDLITTEDGSPSLNWAAGGSSEDMHSSHGARSETDYIYGEALRWLDTNGPHWPNLLVMGLGLGYIEMFALALMPKHPFSITSVEIDDHLRNRFIHWLEGGKVTPYDQVVAEVEKATGYKDLKERCRSIYVTEKWDFYKELGDLPETQFDGIMYDAFSGQSQPELWEEDFLDGVIQKHSKPKCIFSTYAATGSLKRALKKNGFDVETRDGFAQKRESTLAIRQNVT